MRQIFLDTETTGLSTSDDHRIIEIGCVEMMEGKLTGRAFHRYINPQRKMGAEAIEIHGITNEFLIDKPIFQQVVREFVGFIKDAQLVIHNAPFDLEFLDYEFSLIDTGCYPVLPIRTWCPVIDTLIMAREKHPGQRCSLDALCKRYEIDFHSYNETGALRDAIISADIYLKMRKENDYDN